MGSFLTSLFLKIYIQSILGSCWLYFLNIPQISTSHHCHQCPLGSSHQHLSLAPLQSLPKSAFSLAAVYPRAHSHRSIRVDLDLSQVLPPLGSKLLPSLSLRVKARVLGWFFKALPKLAGHFPDLPPTNLPLAHSTLATPTLCYFSSTQSAVFVPMPGTFLPTPVFPTVSPQLPCVFWVFTQMLPSL